MQGAWLCKSSCQSSKQMHTTSLLRAKLSEPQIKKYKYYKLLNWNENDNIKLQDHKSGTRFFSSHNLKKRDLFFSHNFHIFNNKFVMQEAWLYKSSYQSSKQMHTTSLLRAKLSEPQIKNVKITNF